MNFCNCSDLTCSSKKKKNIGSLSIALVGNPNCGKTTLFNALTGAKQKVGNWPGVTVERKSGFFTQCGQTIEVIDLPGVYSLTFSADESAVDERITNEFILAKKADLIINIVDASHLERHLYLTTQLLEMGVPFIIALNMMDVAKQEMINIDVAQLAKNLNSTVVAVQANKGEGLIELKNQIIECYRKKAKNGLTIPYPMAVEKALAKIEKSINQTLLKNINKRYFSISLLENNNSFNLAIPKVLSDETHNQQLTIRETTGEDADILLAEGRYKYIQTILKECMNTSKIKKSNWTEKLDRIVLNRVLGLPIFLLVMYLLFVFSINIGGAFQDFFDISSQTIFVDGFAYLLNKIHSPVWITALLANGIGKGINTTLTFIPVIGSLFLFLSFLEDSGYMARAAFVVDRFMRALGLPGKAFVPMIVGFGCNVPAIMGARTLENKRDRILTIMMTPFMSCGARLAIFALFTTAFFPHSGQNIVFALYLIGIGMAVLTGFLLRNTMLKGEVSPLLMELPLYHIPHGKTLLLHAWQRLKGFVFNAGRLIIPICVLIGVLNSLNLNGSLNTGEGDTHSLLSLIGQWVSPIFSPMGIKLDNWPATVGLLTGVLAKEVVVGTLNTLYSQVGHLTNVTDSFQFWENLSAAFHSIATNLAGIFGALRNPILAQAPIHPVNQGVYGLMYRQFDGQVGAFSYLLFVLLYFPCISTLAVMLRELNRGWALFSACWMTGVAYGASVLFYQAATWMHHPTFSLLWIISIVSCFLLIILMMRWYADSESFASVNTRSKA